MGDIHSYQPSSDEAPHDTRDGSTWSHGHLLMLKTCPVCEQTDDIQQTYSRRDDSLNMPDIWHIQRCGSCSSLYLNPRPDSKSLPLAYQNYYTHSVEENLQNYEGIPRVISNLINGYLNWRFQMNRRPSNKIGAAIFFLALPLRMKLDVYCRHIPRKLCNSDTNLLDIGCGNGVFLARIQETGINAIGCEPDSAAVSANKMHKLKIINGDVFSPELNKKKFNYITLNHVIEHLENPASILERVNQLLTPGGIVWIALPNPNALGLRIFNSGWNGLHPPYHLVLPTQKELRSWLKKAKFNNIKTVRRGVQSTSQWQDSYALAKREGISRPKLFVWGIRRLADLITTIMPAWGEETIIVARKKN